MTDRLTLSLSRQKKKKDLNRLAWVEEGAKQCKVWGGEGKLAYGPWFANT